MDDGVFVVAAVSPPSASVLGAVTTQLRCLDAAREGARAAARGESAGTVRTLAGVRLTVTVWEGRKLPTVDARPPRPADDALSWIRGATL